MKVSEVIKALQTVDPDLDVWFEYDSRCASGYIRTITTYDGQLIFRSEDEESYEWHADYDKEENGREEVLVYSNWKD